MFSNCFSGARILLPRVVLALLAIGSFLARAQTLTLVQSGARFAGSGSPGFNIDSGSATMVNLTPAYLVVDPAGNQYVSDTQNNCVRKIDASGTISTIVGLAQTGSGDTCNTASNQTPTASQGLYRPAGLAIDSFNNLYIADSRHNCVRMLANGATGVAALTTVSGTCGTTTSSTPSPNGLAIDYANNLYISIQDTEAAPDVSTYQVLRQLPGSSLCLMAGAPSASVPNTCSGVTGNVTLNTPSGLALDAAGDLFIADTGNNCIREVATVTTQQTAVGQCANDHTGNPATALSQPFSLAFSPTQSLFITESGAQNNNVISYTLGSSVLTIAAGMASGVPGPYIPTQDGKAALNTPLSAPLGIAADSFGNLFVADSGNGIIRKLSNNTLFPSTAVASPSATLPLTFLVNQTVNLSASVGSDFKIISNTCLGSLTAVSGSSATTCQVLVSFNPTRPGIRSAALRLTDSISGLTLTQDLQATATGSLSVFTPGIVNTAEASLAAPTAVAVDSIGNAYILQSGIATGTASLTMIPFGGGTPQTVIPAGQGLLTPTAIALDASGSYYIADSTHGTISRFGADGNINTTYVTGLDTPTAISVDGFGNLYIAQAGSTHNVIEVYLGGVRRVISGSGSLTSADGVLANTAAFVSPSALALDRNGILYIADSAAHLVYAIDKSGLIHKVAGNGTANTTVPGQATGTALISPASLSVDAAGDIYIADSAANLIYTVFAYTSASGTNIATTLGSGMSGNTGDGGYANLAQINNPVSLAVDSNANLFVVDNGNSSLRQISYPNPTLGFGSIMVGRSSQPYLQSLSNFGTDHLNITSPFSTSDSRFTIDSNSTTCGTTILAGSTCNIGVVFTPTVNGLLTASIAMASDSYNSPQSIQLTGNGRFSSQPQFMFSAQTEVYGKPFSETVFAFNSNPYPTGTITFSVGNQILCTLNTTLVPITTCNATSSGLSAGIYTVNFTYSGDSNYNPATGTVNLIVTAAPLSISVNNTTRLYGGINPTFTGTLSGVLPGETILVSYSTAAIANSPVSNYPVIATLTPVGNTNLSNYTITNTPGTLTITQAPVTITILSATRQYGQSNPALGGTVTGVLNGDNFVVSYTTAANVASPVGTYPILVKDTTGGPGGNYAISLVPANLIVTPAQLSVSASNATRTYGAANPTFTGTTTGTLFGDSVTVSYSTTATPASPVGNYAISATISGPAADNYIATINSGTLTVSPSATATTVAASSPTATTGANVTFTATVSSANDVPSGVVNFSDGSTLLGQVALNTSGTSAFSTAALAPGTHTITASFVPNSNFISSSSSTTEITGVTTTSTGSFTISTPATPQYITGAGATVYQVTLNSIGGFAGQVALACSGLPANATCTFGANPTLTPGGTVTTTVTVATAPMAELTSPSRTGFNPANLAPITAAAVFPVDLSGLGIFFAGLRRRKKLGTQKVRLMVVILFTLGILSLTGCGSPNSNIKTYTISITGTSVSSTAPAQSTSVVLSVAN